MQYPVFPWVLADYDSMVREGGREGGRRGEGGKGGKEGGREGGKGVIPWVLANYDSVVEGRGGKEGREGGKEGGEGNRGRRRERGRGGRGGGVKEEGLMGERSLPRTSLTDPGSHRSKDVPGLFQADGCADAFATQEVHRALQVL